MSDRPMQVAVLGGGVAGLATAYNIESRTGERGLAADVTIFEASSIVGGKLRTICEDGYIVEEGPNGWLDNEPATARLLSSLALDPAVLPSEDATRHRFLLVRGKLRELPLTPPAFIKTDILSPLAKLRVAAELIVPRGKNLGRAAIDPAADETVYDFGRRRLGRSFAELFLDPMVKGIFGGDARRLSLQATFPRMVELESEYGSLLRAMMKLSRERSKSGGGRASPAGPGGTLTGFRRGMATLPRTLRNSIRGDIKTGCPVTRVRRKGDTWYLNAGGASFGPYDCVIEAAPAHAAAGHFAGIELSRLLGQIPYVPMAVVVLALDRDKVSHPLRGFGMLNPSLENRRLLGVLWSTSIFRGRAPEGRVMLRCMAGGAADPGITELSDTDLVRICLEELGPLYGLKGRPERTWVIRHDRAIAQYEPGHLARLRAIEDVLGGMPGLFLTGSSYRGVSTNHCIAEAESTAGFVLDFLAARRGAEGSRSEARVKATRVATG